VAKAVVFDFDGVLADTREAAVAAYGKALEEAGYRIAPAEVRRFWGGGPFLLLKRFFDYRGIAKSESEIEMIAKRKTALQVRMVGKNRLMPGARPLLVSLKRKGFRMGIATANRLAFVKAFLKHWGIDGFFNAIATTEAGDRPKPFPDQFLRAARLLGVDAGDCVAIEDMGVGVRAARRAGMRVIGVLGRLEPEWRLRKAKPDLLVKSLKEKRAILSFLLAERRAHGKPIKMG